MVHENVKQIASFFKVAEEKVIESYNEQKGFIEKQFKNATSEEIEEKVWSIVANNFRPNAMGNNSKTYKGIVIGVGDIKDEHDYNRRMQLKLYEDMKKTVEQTGDESKLKAMEGVVVNIKPNGEVVPLFPYLKGDGTKSGMAGKEIPALKDSNMREVYGFCYPDGEKADDTMMPFMLKRKLKSDVNGNIIDMPMPSFGKIVEFKAGGKEWNGKYTLNSSVTDFVETTDKYLQEGLDAVGIEGMILSLLENNVITFDNINDWKKLFVEDPKQETIPKDLKWSYVVLNNVMCVSQNFDVNDKGKCTMTFVNGKFSLDNNTTIISSTEPSIAEKIEFAVNSNCTIIGRLSIFGKEGEEPMTYLNLMGAIPKKDMWIPRIEAETIEEEEETPQPVKEEVKVEEPPKTKAW